MQGLAAHAAAATCACGPLLQVPRALADKVKSYCDYVIEREVQADEADIIAGLSASLRTQVILHLYQVRTASCVHACEQPQCVTAQRSGWIMALAIAAADVRR
jgi:hypothetical protein